MAQSLNEIAEKTKCCRPETSVKDVILKLRTLKTQYLKEKNNIIRSKRSGVGANEVYVPILWCYDRLNFWDNTGDEVVGESNISFLSEHFDPTSSEIIAEPEVHSLPKTSRSLHTTVPKRKGSVSNMELKALQALSAADKIANAITNKPSSVLRHFLGNLEEEMIVVKDEDLMREMKWKIYDIVKQFQIKQRNVGVPPSRSSTPSRFTNYSRVRLLSEVTDEENSNSTSSSNRNIIESAMEDVFDDEDFL
ncbi:uncharacterized protein LOC129952780 [Eupeodes corollae]|uniref:uncharacterized protein LOC129952780 n=1 Tax=Eupeodes corollae TaxID=290404 RepID=UPI00249117CA|nr:uncharacterized protein LOC129952780 [Eupeodes corollae]